MKGLDWIFVVVLFYTLSIQISPKLQSFFDVNISCPHQRYPIFCLKLTIAFENSSLHVCNLVFAYTESINFCTFSTVISNLKQYY